MSKAAGVCGTAYAEFETFRLSRSSITCRFGPTHVPCRSACTRCGAPSTAHPYGIRFAKSAQNTVVAWGFGSRINGG
jgi:hypothetical protein